MTHGYWKFTYPIYPPGDSKDNWLMYWKFTHGYSTENLHTSNGYWKFTYPIYPPGDSNDTWLLYWKNGISFDNTGS